MSKTAAKRQAHQESSIFQVLVGHWGMLREGHPATYGLTYPQARRELAAWRAARVRELMGEPPLFRCASPSCPGYPWRASNRPHPCPSGVAP